MSEKPSTIGGRVYLDTNILIYMVEGHTTHSTVISRLIDAIDTGAIEAVTSELSLAEVLVKPIADGLPGIVDAYTALLAPDSTIKTHPINRSTLRLSAEIRATLGGRAFDAIHVATAVLSQCTDLVTNDDKIRAPATLQVARLSDLTRDDADDAS